MQPKTFSILLLSLFLSACAAPITMGPQGDVQALHLETQKQQMMAFQRQIEQESRLYTVAYPVLEKNRDFCGNKVKPGYGLAVWNIHTVGRAHKAAAQSLYDLGQGVMVKTVAPRSPALRAGLSPGDIVISVNGQEVGGPTGVKRMHALLIDAGPNPSQIVFEHKGAVKTGILNPVQVCNYPVALDSSPVINAQTDGKIIVVTTGIMRFTENDDELALVVAHELGHNAMGHINKKLQNSLVGSLGGLAVDALMGAAGVQTGGEFSKFGTQLGGMAYSVEFEQEADYVGMYFMERAGFNSAGVADFWRRMAIEGQAAIDHNTSHPATPARFIAIEQTASEISRKKTARQDLIPNYKR